MVMLVSSPNSPQGLSGFGINLRLDNVRNTVIVSGMHFATYFSLVDAFGCVRGTQSPKFLYLLYVRDVMSKFLLLLGTIHVVYLICVNVSLLALKAESN